MKIEDDDWEKIKFWMGKLILRLDENYPSDNYLRENIEYTIQKYKKPH